jgi:hypothetical protein
MLKVLKYFHYYLDTKKAIVKEMNPLLVPLHLGWSRDVTLKKPSGQVGKIRFYFLHHGGFFKVIIFRDQGSA